MRRWISALLLLGALAAPAAAQKVVMEGVAASRYAVKVDTINGRVDIATTSYTGGIANVGLHVASNVVVDSLANPNVIVLYATGAVVARTISLSPAGGAVAGNSSSTMTLCGPLFFVSSNSVTGSTSTVGTALTVFSTFSYAAGSLVVAGDRVIVECAFQNTSNAPGTPVAGTYLGTTALATQAFATASANILVRTRGVLTRVGKMLFFSDAQTQTASATAATSITAGIGVGETSFDATTAQTFTCAASRASGGTVNFIWMRAAKACE